MFNELRLIEQAHGCDPDTMPLVFVHDTEWPYGRRDLYYNPETIPEEYRQPFAQKGIGRHKMELRQSGGINTELCNALMEGGPKNGVLTAVEDYLAQSGLDFFFMNLPVYFGLGVLVTQARLDKNRVLEGEIKRLEDCLKGERLLKVAEQIRLNTLISLQGVQRELELARLRILDLEASMSVLDCEEAK